MALSVCSVGRSNRRFELLRSESVWNPFDMVQFLPARSLLQGAGAIAGIKVDWLETKDVHVFRADLPGLRKEDVRVEVEGGRILQISGERSQEEEKKGDTRHAVERSHGKFVRRFKLPEDAQTDSVSAKVENGVLSVTVPKIEIKTPEKRSIEVTS